MAKDDTVVVLDVSSDDDVGWGDGVAACGSGGGGVVGRDDGDWISEVLDEMDKDKDDSDDVVFVGEVIVKPKLRVSKTLVKCVTNVNSGGDDDDDDDECVVLDGDPDKPISTLNDKGVDDDSEDLLLVSEKGQVACRDYPHARHLCVKFPFNSTPHERHCDQCHCYVCDSLAPCVHWSAGIPTIDHCHATDKDEYWKNQRKSVKKTNVSLPVVSGVPEASFFLGQSSPCQTLSSPSEYVQRYGTPDTVTYGTAHQPGYYSREKFLPHYIPNQSRSAHNNVIQSDGRHNAVNAGSHVISRTPFRRKTITAGVFPTNPYCRNTSRHSHGNQFVRRNPPPGRLAARCIGRHGGGTPVLNTYKDSSRTNFADIATNLIPNISAQTNIGSGTANYTPSPSQMFPQAHGSSVNKTTVGPQHQVSSQIFVGSNYTSSMPTQAVGTDPNWERNFDSSFPFQALATACPEVGKFSQTSMPSQSLVTILSNMAKTAQPNACTGSAIYQYQDCSLAASLLNDGKNESVQANPTQSGMLASSTDFYESHACSLATSLLNAGKNVSVQRNPTQSAMHSSSKDFDFINHSNQPLPVNQLQNAVQRDEPAVPLYGNSKFPACTNLSPPDLQFDPWIFENDSSLDGLGNPELNVFSPEAAVLDAGLFDF